MAIVLKLVKNDAGDEDVVFENGKIVLSENGEAAAVRMKERMLLERSEALASILVDTTKNPLAGLNWEGIIFDAAKSKVEKELEIKRVILSSPGIQAITYWSWVLAGRELQLDFKVNTDWGELAVGETIQL